MTRKELDQYSDLLKEQEETKDRIAKLEKQLEKIIAEGNVTDKVMGGDGGKQPFKIEGFPIPEYSKKKMWLNKNKAILKEREEKIANLILRIENFISTVDDSLVRRIITFRYVENLSWDKVADKIGGNNTSDSVRKACERYIERVNGKMSDMS